MNIGWGREDGNCTKRFLFNSVKRITLTMVPIPVIPLAEGWAEPNAIAIPFPSLPAAGADMEPGLGLGIRYNVVEPFCGLCGRAEHRCKARQNVNR